MAHLLCWRPRWSIAMPVKWIDAGWFAMGMATLPIVRLVLNLFSYYSDPEANQYKEQTGRLSLNTSI